MTTARSIIEQALRKISVLGRGEVLQSAEAQDALTALNNMMSSWSAGGGMVFTQVREEFSLTGAGSYTIGSGANFDTTRPLEIDAAFVRQGGTDYELTQYNAKQWSNITTKDSGGTPEVFYYDNNNPTGKLYIYPDASGYTLVLFSRKELESFTSLTDDITLPAGYERALVYSLACELAPEYEKQPTGMLVAAATESKRQAFIGNTRHRRPNAKIDLAAGERFNINRGY